MEKGRGAPLGAAKVWALQMVEVCRVFRTSRWTAKGVSDPVADSQTVLRAFR